MAQDITKGFKKLVRNQCTPQEVDEVMGMINDHQYAEIYTELIAAELAEPVADREISDDLRVRLDLRLKQILESEKSATQSLWPRLATISIAWRVAAAVAAIVFCIWLYTDSAILNLNSQSAYQNDVAPGRNTATLTLGNGKTITLNDTKIGVIVNGNNLKYNDGSRIQGPISVPSPNSEEILTATTPRGGQYQFTLPDGSKVWLNADSKISFPTQFSGARRKILLTGEAYFEVAKNKAKPFIVESKGQEVTVLGTHFNINAYGDESSTRTTLLEGSVRVSSGAGANLILKPNEQSVLNTKNELKMHQANLETVMAWKNGDFIFKDESLENIMMQITRWYDVDVVYEDLDAKSVVLGGWVSRSKNLSAVLKIIESIAKIHFKVEGRRVTVMK